MEWINRVNPCLPTDRHASARLIQSKLKGFELFNLTSHKWINLYNRRSFILRCRFIPYFRKKRDFHKLKRFRIWKIEFGGV